MTRSTINPTRYRALFVGLLLLAGCSLGGAIIMSQLTGRHPAESLIFVFGAVVLALLGALARQVGRAGDRAALEKIAKGAIAVGALLLLQRIAWDFYGPQMLDASRTVFRPSLAFLPFLWLAAIVVLQSRAALRLSWLLWAGVVLIVLPSLCWYVGLSPAREGVAAVVVWVVLANPLFMLLLTSLPQYQEQIDQHAAEISQMRERTELMDKLAESERRFNLVLQSLEVGVWEAWVGPPEGRLWTPRFYELVGYTPGELPATEENLKSLMHPDERDAVWRKGVAQLRAAEIMDVDFRLKTQHRGYRWFNSRAKAHHGPDGRITRITGAITDIHEQRLSNDALRMAQAELTRLAYRDTLTDQYNRRYFDEHFQREWERAHRTREPLALLLIDLDHFKAYNDHYGHPVGDRCLVQVAALLARGAGRSADIVARLGGEEFGVVLPGTSAAGAEEVAQRIRAQLAEAAIAHAGAPIGRVTVSIGVSVTTARDGPDTAALLDQADKALYEAKRRGRDGVMIYGSNPLTRTGEHPAG